MMFDRVDFPAVIPLSPDKVDSFVVLLASNDASAMFEIEESFKALSWETQATALWVYEQGVVSALSLRIALQSDSPDVVFRAALMLVEYATMVYPYLIDEYRTGDLLSCSIDVVWASLWHGEQVGEPFVLGTREWMRAAAGLLCFMTACGEEHLADVEDAGDGMGIVGVASNDIAALVMRNPSLGYRVGEFMAARGLSNSESDAAFVVNHFKQEQGYSAVSEGHL